MNKVFHFQNKKRIILNFPLKQRLSEFQEGIIIKFFVRSNTKLCRPADSVTSFFRSTSRFT